jgi:hypothetical protein
MACFDEHTLLDFVDGRLSEGELHRISIHVAACAECRKIVGTLTSREGATGTVRTASASSEPTPAGPLPPGATVARYRIESLVGAGSMGAVYAAYDPDLDRRVALKLLSPAPRSHELRALLLREAQAMAKVTHAHVATVYDVGTWRQQLFIAMEFVRGGTLRTWLRARPRSVPEILDVLLRAGRGLAEAHTAGLVHRDFKPDNVLVGDDGRVRVTDFGLARPPHDPRASDTPLAGHSSWDTVDPRSTRTGTLVGTPAYMAPEQLDGAPANERSDEFAFCVALYEALYGRRPFEGANVIALRMSMRRDPPAPDPLGSRVPGRVHAVLRKGLSKRPSDRYGSMHELLDALEGALRASRRGSARRAALVVAILSITAIGAAMGAARSGVLARSTRLSQLASAGASSERARDVRLAVTGVHRITFGEDCEEFPSFTPDGTRVVYDGTVRRQLVHLFDGPDERPLSKADRRHGMGFRPEHLPRRNTRRLPADDRGGGRHVSRAPRRHERSAHNPVASPNDRRIAYLAGATDDTLLPSLLDPETGATKPLSVDLEPARYFGMTFSTDGRSVVVLRGTQQLVEIDTVTGRKTREMRLQDDLNALTYIEKGIVVVAMQWIGDLWMADASFR